MLRSRPSMVLSLRCVIQTPTFLFSREEQGYQALCIQKIVLPAAPWLSPLGSKRGSAICAYSMQAHRPRHDIVLHVFTSGA